MSTFDDLQNIPYDFSQTLHVTLYTDVRQLVLLTLFRQNAQCGLWVDSVFFFPLTSLDFFGLSRLLDMEQASAGKQATPFDKLQRTTFFKIPPTSPGGAPPRRCIATYIGFLTVFISPE